MSKGAFINYVFSIQEKGVLRFATSANIGRGFLNTVKLYILELFGTILGGIGAFMRSQNLIIM